MMKPFSVDPLTDGQLVGRVLLLGLLLTAMGQQVSHGRQTAATSSPSPEFTDDAGSVTTCATATSEPCTLLLHGDGAPAASPECRNDGWIRHLSFQQPRSFSDSNGDDWWETVLDLDLDPRKGCNCAVLRIYFTGTPHGFMVNIGDSASNDGQGGGAGTNPLHSAELQVAAVNERPQLAVLTTRRPDVLLRLNLPDLDGDFLEARGLHQRGAGADTADLVRGLSSNNCHCRGDHRSSRRLSRQSERSGCRYSKGPSGML